MLLFFSDSNINAMIIIIKGFKSSIGWNLGKNKKSNHLFEPLISTPIIGTNTKKTKKIKKDIIDTRYKFFLSRAEKKIIQKKPIIMKKKCLKKK